MPGACVSNGLCHILLLQEGHIGSGSGFRHRQNTVCMGKGAQGTWCVYLCILVAVTCDEVDEIEIKCTRVV